MMLCSSISCRSLARLAQITINRHSTATQMAGRVRGIPVFSSTVPDTRFSRGRRGFFKSSAVGLPLPVSPAVHFYCAFSPVIPFSESELRCFSQSSHPIPTPQHWISMLSGSLAERRSCLHHAISFVVCIYDDAIRLKSKAGWCVHHTCATLQSRVDEAGFLCGEWLAPRRGMSMIMISGIEATGHEAEANFPEEDAIALGAVANHG